MMNRRILLVAAVLACLAPSCKTWAKLPDHKVTVVADNQVKRGGDFSFCVTLADSTGAQVHGATYQYKLLWVELEGMTHKAKSGIYEKIRVKGAIGKATLQILGYDAQDRFGVIATHSFQVD
jgi:hypothetical protein